MSTYVVKSAVCFSILALPYLSISAEAELPLTDVVSFWNARQHEVDGITFHVQGDVFYPKGFGTYHEEVRGKLVRFEVPPQDHSYETRAVIRVDLKGGRAFRRVIEERLYNLTDVTRPNGVPATTPPEVGIVYPVDDICLYNGQQYKHYIPMSTNHPDGRAARLKATELCISDKRILPIFRGEHVPLLLSVGFVRIADGFAPTNLRAKLNPRDFKQVGEATIDGKRCAVLHTVLERGYYNEYVVEESEPYLIRETKVYNKEGQLFESSSINYQLTDAGYLPETWQMINFSFENGKAQTFDMRLTDFEINPAFTAADFDVDPTSGTRTVDKRRPRESMRYVIGDEEVPELPVAEYEMQQKARAARNWVYLIVAAVVIVLIGGAVWYRRARA